MNGPWGRVGVCEGVVLVCVQSKETANLQFSTGVFVYLVTWRAMSQPHIFFELYATLRGQNSGSPVYV